MQLNSDERDSLLRLYQHVFVFMLLVSTAFFLIAGGASIFSFMHSLKTLYQIQILKVKFTLELTIEAQRGSRDRALLFL